MMRILQFIISVFIVFITIKAVSQTNEDTQKKDSISYKTGYGLRIGLDISKPILGALNKNYKGIEFVGDYRIAKNHYIATELGYENQIINEDYTSSKATGKFVKIGFNYNTYKNWLDMNNEIYVGLRYGYSTFNQKLESYTINSKTNYFKPILKKPNTNFDNLSAHWAEFQLGIKVETFKNLFIGFHGSYKVGINLENPKNFKSLYIPGFNRVFSNNTGFGFNYTISYLIPFVNK